MKSKLYYLLWLFAIAPLAFISCDDDNEIEEATLEVSMDPVNFAKAGGEQTVTITTNKDKWVATSPLESTWLTLTQSGNQLSVKASENTEGVERKGYILVNAGGAAAKISVIQSAGDVILNISAEKVTFAIKGGEQRIDVVSNDIFKVEVDDAAKEWLNTTHMEGTTYFTISANVNGEADVRTGKIYVTAGSITKEVAVSQEGKDLIVLPFVAQEASIGKIVAFEQERGSVLIKLPDGLFNPDQYYFATTNEDFPQVGYQCPDTGTYLQGVTATTNSDLCKGNKFEKFMTDKGFEKTGDGQYEHKEFPYTVSLEFAKDGVTIHTVYTPKQDKGHPTFAEFPLKVQMTWTGLPEEEIHGKKYDEIVAWEATAGGTFSEKESVLPGFAWYNIAENDANITARAYWMNTKEDVPADSPFMDEVSSARVVYDNIDLAMWYDESAQKYYMTKEFTALLAKEGFNFLRTNQGYDFYQKENNVIAFKVARFEGYLNEQPVLDFQTFKVEAGTSSVSLMTNKDKLTEFVKMINQKMQKMEKRQPLKSIK